MIGGWAMTGEDFQEWLDRMDLSGLEAARRLGCSKNSILVYRTKGAPEYIGLACAALAASLPPWTKAEKPDA